MKKTERTTKMKHAIIVAGPERSGTRLATEWCIQAGFDGVATAEARPEFGGFSQKWDNELPADEPRVVIRRSFPYHPDRKWCMIDELIKELQEVRGYDVTVMETFRHDFCVASSQAKNNYVAGVMHGLVDIAKTRAMIADSVSLTSPNYVEFEYESFIRDSGEYTFHLCYRLGLKQFTFDGDLYNGNMKHYGLR